MLRTICDALLTVVYPQNCHVCGDSVENSADGTACDKCWRKTRIFADNEVLCGKCGAFLRDHTHAVETFCHRCDEHFYDAAKAVGIYDGALLVSIVHLKRNPFVSRKLCQLFLTAFENSGFDDADLIIPVPLSVKRRIERGHNQAAILGNLIAPKYQIKIDENSFARVVDTPMHRRAMDEKARELTVKNAFEVKRPNFIADKNILLIDDVLTSGATVSACAKVLKKAGAKKVYVLTVARVISN